MGIFEAEVRGRTGEEDVLTSRVFGTLEIVDRQKFLSAVLKDSGVLLPDGVSLNDLSFSYWQGTGKRTPDVLLQDKSVLIIVECKLGAPLDAYQLVDEYKDGLAGNKALWLVAISADYAEPEQVQAVRQLITKQTGAEPSVAWISWQRIYALLRGALPSGNETEKGLIRDLLTLLKAKGLSTFDSFTPAHLATMSAWSGVTGFLRECAEFLGSLSARLAEKGISADKFLNFGGISRRVQAPDYWVPHFVFLAAWDNGWERDTSQCLYTFFRLSPFELTVGYRIGFWSTMATSRPMLAEKSKSSALLARLSSVDNCVVTYHGRGYETKDRVAGDSLGEDTFALEVLNDVVDVVIGRVFSPEEMASPKLLDEVEDCLVRMRDFANENGLHFSKQERDSFVVAVHAEDTEDYESQPPV